MWPKCLPLAAFSYNTFNTPNLANYSPYKLDFGRMPKLLLNLETTPDIKVLGTFKNITLCKIKDFSIYISYSRILGTKI